jgi:glutaredoxin-related protein
LETTAGSAYHMKTDIFKRKMWYVYEHERGVFIELSVDRVKEVIAMNKEGKKPDELRAFVKMTAPAIKEPDYQNVVGQDSISRFDKAKGNRRDRGGNNRNRGRGRGGNNRNRGGRK